jgi:hypothetical protein
LTTPRDINLSEWLDGTKHHAPVTESTILAHQAARNLVGQLGTTLFQLLPPGRDKSLVYTALEEVLMRSNRAIALSGGPDVVTDDLRRAAGHQVDPGHPMLPDPDEERLHKGERKPTFRSTVRTSTGPTRVEVSAEQVSPAEGYIQVGVLTQYPNQAAFAASEEGFRGFYATVTGAEEWAALMKELASAGAHVWGTQKLGDAVG